MVAIVYQTDKRSGITYAYQSIPHWNKEKKQSSAKRPLIERLLDKLDVIEYFKLPGRLFQVGEILEQQKRLYDDLGVSPPASLRVGGNQGCIVSK